MKIFGDDGFRSRFGEHFMTMEFLTAFAHGLADFYDSEGRVDPILLARDTRASGVIIEGILQSLLASRGVHSISVGVAPTPSLSHILAKAKFALGVMITASHNPACDNGVKLFQHSGYKLDGEQEAYIEKKVLNYLRSPYSALFVKRGKIDQAPELLSLYSGWLRQMFASLKVSGKLLIDCSYGAFSSLATSLFGEWADVEIINNAPNGLNINLDCGALEPERLLKRVQEHACAFGVAFDGDGDRCVFVSDSYGVIEPEKLIILFTSVCKSREAYDGVVSTEICNKALALNCHERGVHLTETPVGDRNVVQAVNRDNAILGAEPSGHYYFPVMQRSMDGMLAVFFFLKYLSEQPTNVIADLRQLKHFKRVSKTIAWPQDRCINLDALSAVLAAHINDVSEKLVIRESMWDPVVRVYYDYETENRFAFFEQIIQAKLGAELSEQSGCAMEGATAKNVRRLS